MENLNNLLKFLTFLLFIIMLGVTVGTVNAQNLPCAPKVKGLHYAFPAYNHTPVLFSNMPYDVMVSYIIADSVLKHSDEARTVASSFFKRFNDNQVAYDNDTLNYAYKYLYKISDYDPLLFLNFIMQSHGTRKISPFRLYDHLVDCVEKMPNGL